MHIMMTEQFDGGPRHTPFRHGRRLEIGGIINMGASLEGVAASQGLRSSIRLFMQRPECIRIIQAA